MKVAVRSGGAALLTAGSLVALLGAFALTGTPLSGRYLQEFEPRGVVAARPSDIRTVEISEGRERVAFRRKNPESWLLDGTAQEVPADLAAHLETALRFIHRAAPARTIEADDFAGTSLAEFGLDPPAYVVSLGGAAATVATAEFGTLTPAGTSQYVRLLGQARLLLLPRHVGAEWRVVADIARRSLPAGASEARTAAGQAGGFLLPVSMDSIWAVEIVAGGQLHRFERDGAGAWFLHTGQHSHAGGAPTHVADPAKAPMIGAALDAFGATRIEAIASGHLDRGDRERFGLQRPPLLALLYARDSSTPLARVEIGAAADASGFSRYARLAPDGTVVTIAAYEARRLADLAQAAGVSR